MNRTLRKQIDELIQSELDAGHEAHLSHDELTLTSNRDQAGCTSSVTMDVSAIAESDLSPAQLFENAHEVNFSDLRKNGALK